MRHDADMCSGGLYDYLGHFGRREFLAQGHNDMPEPTQLGHVATIPTNPGMFTYRYGDKIGGSLAPDYDSAKLMNKKPANDR